jgi:hypothetical protein
LDFIRKWLYGGEDGEGKGFIGKLKTVATLTWSEDHGKDFVAMKSESERDIWTSMIVTKILNIWHRTLGRWKVSSTCTLDKHPLTDSDRNRRKTASSNTLD